jgi:hypothetical protein
MAFEPVLSICFVTCGDIRFVDTTNVYHATNNTTGWGAANSAEGTDVATAVITVLDSDDDTVFTETVTTQIPTSVIGEIIFTDKEYSLDDGEYTLQYVVTFDDTSSYTYTTTFEKTCGFEACVDAVIATIPGKICDDGCNTDYIDEVLLIEGLLYGYMCAASCDKDTIKTNIQARMNRICDFNCNCD